MNLRNFSIGLSVLLLAGYAGLLGAAEPARPNILWFIVDDMP